MYCNAYYNTNETMKLYRAAVIQGINPSVIRQMATNTHAANVHINKYPSMCSNRAVILIIIMHNSPLLMLY